MTDLAWMKTYIGDEAAVAGHLSAEEFGAFERLRRHYWQHGDLPTEESRLVRVTGVDPGRWVAVSTAILTLLEAAIRRLDVERSDASLKRERKVSAGRKGAAVRWAPDGKGNAVANGKDVAPAINENGKGNSFANAVANAEPIATSTSARYSALEEGTSTHVRTRAPAREEPIPTVGSKAQAEAWLVEQGVFPGYLDKLAQRMLDQTLVWEDVRSAA